mmetsp:Transcript_15557/g.45012  ORF Transcript_15557/g.45012 Transcript_15557/m.45012 type:complete len:83 (+) Transcript_15557:96-344(+)
MIFLHDWIYHSLSSSQLPKDMSKYKTRLFVASFVPTCIDESNLKPAAVAKAKNDVSSKGIRSSQVNMQRLQLCRSRVFRSRG